MLGFLYKEPKSVHANPLDAEAYAEAYAEKSYMSITRQGCGSHPFYG